MQDLKVVELEHKVNLVLNGMNLILFGKAEATTPKERREIERRFKQYVTGKDSEFVELKNLQGTHTHYC